MYNTGEFQNDTHQIFYTPAYFTPPQYSTQNDIPSKYATQINILSSSIAACGTSLQNIIIVIHLFFSKKIKRLKYSKF